MDVSYQPWWETAAIRKYENLALNGSSVIDDYAAAMAAVPQWVLVPVFSEAFRSPLVPRLSELVAAIYDPLSPKDRLFFWGPLLEAVPVLRYALPHIIPAVGPPSISSADSITAREMVGIVDQAESLSSDLYASLCLFFGHFSGLTLGLPSQAKIAILRLLAVHAIEKKEEFKRQQAIQLQISREKEERRNQQDRYPYAGDQQMQQRQDFQEAGEENTGSMQYVEEAIVDPFEPTSGPTQQPPGPQARSPSVQVFHDHDGNRGVELQANDAFQAAAWYQIQVSISPDVRGVSGVRRPIREPHQKSSVDILVTAHADRFDILGPIGKIVLPALGDSTENAQFRIRPQGPSASSSEWHSIEFRLFYKFNLLEVFSVRAIICAPESNEPAPMGDKPIVFDQQPQIEFQDFDLIPPRALHIYVQFREAQYRLTFTLRRDQDKVQFPCVDLPLTDSDLENRIAALRKRLFWVCSSRTLGAQVTGNLDEFTDHLKALAEEGSNIWSLLFDGGGSISELGQWLKANPLPDSSAIQVSIDPQASNFVLAWSMLYDRWVPDSPPVVDGFWGMRYVIEQRRVGACMSPTTAPVLKEIGAMFWKFDQTKSQVEYLNGLLGQATGTRPILNGPIDDAVAAFACLNACSSDVIYFYTHGFTGLANAERYGFSVQDFLKIYEKLPPETRKALRYIYDDIQNKEFDSDRSYIELSSGRLALDDLYKRMSKLPQQPIVLLNMCDSAQVIPSLSRGFIQFFLTRRARAVLGTECPIRPVFADFVGRMLLKSLLEGVPIGRALLKMRRSAAEQNNLLGLAYTLFGSADAAFRPVLFL